VEFFTALWDTVEGDILEVYHVALSSGKLHSNLNTGLFFLIPKGGPTTNLKNWRPITLLGIVYKIVAKTLAKRLQPLLDIIIRPNQTGFIKERSIIDNVFLAFESMEWARESSQDMVMLLLDFEKAYDRVEWGFLDGNLVKIGFNQKWIM